MHDRGVYWIVVLCVKLNLLTEFLPPARRGPDCGDHHPFSGGQADCFLRRKGVRDSFIHILW